MWDKIKKAINSDLSKPLNTFIQDIHNSWATQRNRLDANISSRATNDGVWSASGRMMSELAPSNTVRLTRPQEITVTSGHQSFSFYTKVGGSIRVSLEAILHSGSGSFDFEVLSAGVSLFSSQVGPLTWSYATYTVDTIPVNAGVNTIRFTRPTSGANFRVRNVRIMHDYDANNLPKLL